MNTPAHVVINLCIARGRTRLENGAVVLGALLPDAPMFLFYAWQKLWLNTPESVIWREAYHDPRWQIFFDVFNSVPLIAGIALVGWLAKSRVVLLGALSMFLHVLGDLPLHHDDAHRHFFPISHWRFESPVSYWDPQHYGQWFAPLEIMLSAVCLLLLFRRYKSKSARAAVALMGASYLAYGLFAWIVWA